MFSIEHSSSMGPASCDGGGGEEDQQAFCLAAKKAVEFSQVLAST